jgi:hypothetical protein
LTQVEQKKEEIRKNNMKKVMIAVAIVCATAFANAANFNWGFLSADVMDPSGSYIDGGMASLYIGTTLIATSGQNSNYTFGSFDYTTSDSTGKVQSLGTGDIDGSFVGQAYKLVLSYTDGDGKAWEYVYNGTSSYEKVPGAPGDPANNFESFVTDYAVQAGDWTPAGGNVPEPTSGLLLLLGMAGLALRRKQA